MIRIAALAAAAVLAALPVRADDWAECKAIAETARAMAACSRMIDGGTYGGPSDGRDRPAFRTGLMACATDPNC